MDPLIISGIAVITGAVAIAWNRPGNSESGVGPEEKDAFGEAAAGLESLTAAARKRREARNQQASFGLPTEQPDTRLYEPTSLDGEGRPPLA